MLIFPIRHISRSANSVTTSSLTDLAAPHNVRSDSKESRASCSSSSPMDFVEQGGVLVDKAHALFFHVQLFELNKSRLTDSDRLRAARVHPVNVLVAQRTYASGASYRGTASWEPTARVADALDAAFYAAFGAVEPAGKRLMLAVDVSGSMGFPVSGMAITAREASAALTLVQLATEPGAAAYAFSREGRSIYGVKPLGISPRRRLDDALAVVDAMPFGGTDCALPMLYAAEQGMEVDAFVIYTDNETWAGKIHDEIQGRRVGVFVHVPLVC